MSSPSVVAIGLWPRGRCVVPPQAAVLGQERLVERRQGGHHPAMRLESSAIPVRGMGGWAGWESGETSTTCLVCKGADQAVGQMCTCVHAELRVK